MTRNGSGYMNLDSVPPSAANASAFSLLSMAFRLQHIISLEEGFIPLFHTYPSRMRTLYYFSVCCQRINEPVTMPRMLWLLFLRISPVCPITVHHCIGYPPSGVYMRPSWPHFPAKYGEELWPVWYPWHSSVWLTLVARCASY